MAETKTWTDWCLNGPYAHYIQEARLGGCRPPFDLVRSAQPAGDWSDPAVEDFCLTVNVGGKFVGEIDVGLGRQDLNDSFGSMRLLPDRTASSIVIDDRQDLLFVSIPRRLVDACSDAEASPISDFGRVHESSFKDRFIFELVHRLWEEAAADRPQGALFADAAMQTLVQALRLRSFGEAATPDGAQALSKAQMRRLHAYMEDHICEDIALDDLAAVAGLSRFHFSRAFKTATGETPRRYIMARRVERVQELLTATQMTITEIAYACGFSSSQHLATVFCKHVGATPSAYRKERLT